ncbi:acyl-CoA N-acyltransferase [Dendrothele bispora CBS 962.96]|uniref:Acyl-CoA N-acyltransferase n=1 Tax=Dendrothele bispora (strain CBS 962.96) TaxID=1314807 RepID=A0A4S8MDT2_DENBC|nr:acyl-CoA N-acyltransferase [Dendrothele bispora CBS 962.96]
MDDAQNLENLTPFPPLPIIALENVVVRPYHRTDLKSMCHHADNPKIAQWMTNMFPSPYTLEAGQIWLDMKLDEISDASKMQTDFIIAVDEGKTSIGGIGLKPGSDVEERYMEVGYWIGEEFWGRGLATAVLRAFVQWTFTEHQNIERLGARTYDGNEASLKVLKKVGFIHEGTLRKHVWKNGAFKDLLMLGLLREDFEASK